MPNLGVFPQTVNWVTIGATITTSSNSGNAQLTLPSASSYRFCLQTNTVSGTSPTLQVAIGTSFDQGATWNIILSFTALTTSGQGRQMQLRPYLGFGDQSTTDSPMGFAVSTSAPIALPTGPTVVNGPINPQYMKVFWNVGGTSPSFSSVALQYSAVAQDASD